MNRRFFFSTVVGALTAFWLRLFPSRYLPVPANPVMEGIEEAKYRQIILDAFASDSYLLNAMDVQHLPIYDAWSLKPYPRGSFAAYLDAESRILSGGA